MPVCASTLLTLLRRAGAQEFPTPRVLGVDDWGFQQKHPTGTLLVDLEKHRVVDVLLGSDEEVFSRWLQKHPGVEVIARDRGAGYRKAAAKAASSVEQVLDRWHLVKNLGEVLQKILAHHMTVIRQAAKPDQGFSSAPILPAWRVSPERRQAAQASAPRSCWTQPSARLANHDACAGTRTGYRRQNAGRNRQSAASQSPHRPQVSEHAHFCCLLSRPTSLPG